jgi:murein DD-endopeptidase MepM/ murein hydrolase activator NlpD
LVLAAFASSVSADEAREKAKATSASARTAAREKALARGRAERLGLGTLKAAGKLLQGRVDPAWLRATGPDAWPGALRLPVATGHVSRGFGSGKGGYHQAVDIAGALGTTVRSAAPGIVGYADDGVSGYGNLIIIIHPGGFITTYAHNQKLLVSAGQRVARSQQIAALGSTGRSMGPHLHTELLWRGLNCDPMPLFRPAARHKNGEPAVERLSLWKDSHKKPKSIRCAPRKHHPDYEKPVGDTDDDD